MNRFDSSQVVITSLLGVFLVGVLFAGVLMIPQTAKAQESITLRYAFFAPKWTFPGRQMQFWVQEVEERTGGKVKIQTFYGGSLLGPKDMYQGVEQGISDIGMTLPSYDPRGFPLLSVFALPLHMPNSTVASLTALDIVKEYDPKPLQKFKVIAVFTTEPAYIQSKEPITSLADAEGKKMRTRGASIPIAKALGFSPIGMPMPEVYESLQKGVISGNITSREVLKDFKIAEYANHVTDYTTDVGLFVAVMNKQKWNSLPSDVQNVIDNLRPEVALWTGTYHDFVNVQNALDWARKNHNLQVHALDSGQKEEWDARLQRVTEQWIDEKSGQGLPAQEIVDRVKELRNKYSEFWAPNASFLEK